MGGKKCKKVIITFKGRSKENNHFPISRQKIRLRRISPSEPDAYTLSILHLLMA
jgi:hypothetical protein